MSALSESAAGKPTAVVLTLGFKAETNATWRTFRIGSRSYTFIVVEQEEQLGFCRLNTC